MALTGSMEHVYGNITILPEAQLTKSIGLQHHLLLILAQNLPLDRRFIGRANRLRDAHTRRRICVQCLLRCLRLNLPLRSRGLGRVEGEFRLEHVQVLIALQALLNVNA